MTILKNKSKISSANSTSVSIRTSIPLAVAQILNVKAGDTLDWIVDINDNNDLFVTVEKSK